MTLNATQKNLLFAAGTVAVAAAGPIGPVSVFGLLAQPALAATKWTKGRSILDKVGQAALGFGLSFIAVGTGAIINPTSAPQTQVAEAPAPVEQVVEAPAPVVEAPVIVEVPSPIEEGDFTTTSHWADAADTSNSGTATYNTDTKTVTWHTSAFGQTETDSCTNGKHNTGLDCSVSYDSNGYPTRAIVTDSYDGYRISTTSFRF